VKPETIPLVVVALLLVTAEGGVGAVDLVLSGDQRIETPEDAVVVANGSAVVPANVTVEGPVVVASGDLRVEGTVDGSLTQLSGGVTLADGARVTGEYRIFGGERSIAAGAVVARRTQVEILPAERPLWARLLTFAIQTLVLAAAAYLLGRRAPDALANVAGAARDHALVSGTVGALTGVTFLALFVFMAFTLVLIPVSVLGILGGIVAVTYGLIALGALVGQYLPVEAPEYAAAGGVVVVQVALRALGYVPLVGDLLGLVLAVVGLGAVLVTYFGLQRFEPPDLSPPEA
jgi:hypothetical protein